MTNEQSRKLKNYLNDKSPCKDCIVYPVCQNEDVVIAVYKCVILSRSIAGYKEKGLYMVISGAHEFYHFYVYHDTGYIGNFKGRQDQYYG